MRVPVAQWIEQLPSKQWAGGSNPSRDARDVVVSVLFDVIKSI